MPKGLFPVMPRREDIVLVALAFVFLMGQIIGALLNCFGWPSQWL